MGDIHEPNDTFNFENLRLSKPIAQTSTGFLSKYMMNENPLYIQPPKCTVKQVMNNKGKKMYCDLVFQQENEQFIRWIENLESRSQKMIFEKKDTWFNSDIDMGDIEECFASPLKIYKSGRSYIIRTIIQSSLGKPQIKIYDENENDVPFEDVKEETSVMVILELNGIRCSSRSFHIEIEIKQMMVTKPKNIFNSFILSKETYKPEQTNVQESLEMDREQQESLEMDREQTNVQESLETDREQQESLETDREQTNIQESLETDREQTNVQESLETDREQQESLETDREQQESLETEPIKIDTTEELCEIDLDLDKMDDEIETISIKNKNDVYYKMYQEAREKAKVARDLALSAYLEAKRIKNTYMLDVDSDSDSEEEEDSDSEEEEQ